MRKINFSGYTLALSHVLAIEVELLAQNPHLEWVLDMAGDEHAPKLRLWNLLDLLGQLPRGCQDLADATQILQAPRPGPQDHRLAEALPVSPS